ncbi:hypothetical protein I0Q76_23445, partial [Klebsiella pneumoniae]|nr:hypothetical protein [Klebsiella pneumoniae]
CQIRIFQNETGGEYISNESQRKYFGNVRPTVSAAESDNELTILEQIRENEIAKK